MEITGSGKSPNSALSFRYNANNEELEELFNNEDEVPPEVASVVTRSESASPKKGDKDKTPSILDKYFKSIRSEKLIDKLDDPRLEDTKTPPKEVSSSPMKDYLNRFGKRGTVSEGSPEAKEGSNETWKLFHDFKSKITQAVEDMKSKSQEDREKSVPRENSISDSEDNSAPKDSDQQSVGDTDNQVSSLDSSMQNLSDVTQPQTARVTEREQSVPSDNKNLSDSSDDTNKNLVFSPSQEVLSADPFADDSMEVESGVEALEDNVDANMGTMTEEDKKSGKGTPVHTSVPNIPLIPSLPIVNIDTKSSTDLKYVPPQKTYFFTFTTYFFTIIVFVNVLLLRESQIWKGFLLGLWCFYILNILHTYILDNFFGDEPNTELPKLRKSTVEKNVSYIIPTVKEHTPLKKFECWVNHYRYREYDPVTYNINRTATAFMKLEGCNLRISYTRQKISKRSLWNEKIENPSFYQHRLYNLTGAKVALLPEGLVQRRLWSKKYPVCVVLSDKEPVQVLERETGYEKRFSESLINEKKFKDGSSQHDVDSTTTPEKKRKFVWRKREKSMSRTSEGEASREGLRQRLARKMHKDKKIENVLFDEMQENESVQSDEIFHEAVSDLAKVILSSKDDDEDIFDDNDTELSKLLEEADAETDPGDGEWTVHSKSCSGLKLFLFGRTGRDKFELFRRLAIAINEANSEPPSEEKTASDSAADNRENSSSTVYKLSDKDTVSFAKTGKTDSMVSEGVTINMPSPVPSTFASTEKHFWPYLLKIIQDKSSASCGCRALPAEMTWVNTMLARMMYDIMKNDSFVSKLQTRVQRKLHTLKLPSFMSPLLVTELSLSGACPQIEWVATPSWDERGIWLDADLRYEGGAYIAVLTQINLMKLKQKNVSLEENLAADNVDDENTTASSIPFPHKKLKPAIYDSEAEDSAESSSDDESPPVQPVDSNENMPTAGQDPATPEASSKKRFLRIVDRLATSKYFQQVTDYKYVKKAMEGLSHTDIKLQIDLQALDGRVTINLPPPPHDRIWVGFRTNPQLVLKARPAVGARTLRFAHISNWIEQKLSKEFEKVLVLPNLEDILVDFMTPTPTVVE